MSEIEHLKERVAFLERALFEAANNRYFNGTGLYYELQIKAKGRGSAPHLPTPRGVPIPSIETRVPKSARGRRGPKPRR